jgi:hypothetical protein
MAELEKSILEKACLESADFQKFLLKGPVMKDEQYDVYLENRKMMNQNK